MKYWLTTHWAPSIRNGKAQPHKGVWVKDGRREVIEPVQPGDLVFIYESKGGKQEKETNAQGDEVVIRRERGRQGVVALLEVTAEAVEIPFGDRKKYVDDDSIWWRYRADTQRLNSMGFVDLNSVRRIVGWKSNYSMHGIGKFGSGLKELTSSQFQELKKEFLRSQPATQDILVRAARAPEVGHGNGGEGPVHKALKLRVAGNPSEVLGEEGLQCVRVEAPFATNDRVDIVLKDKFGRYVMVEIEVDCGPDEMAGPLQCMKYRAMWAYLEGRPVEEVRTMLVAHSLDTDLKQRMRNADIECIVVPRLRK